MQQYPEPIAGAFILNSKGKLFLIKSHKWQNLYCVPGGHVEVGETIEQALKREVKEETQLDVYDPEFLGVYDFIPDGTYWKQKHMIFLNYRLKTKGRKVVLNEEAQEYIWITPKKALQLPLEKYTKLTIESYLILSIKELTFSEETAEVLSVPNIKKHIAMSRQQIKKGKFVSLTELS
jgi:nucleoside triphosphatase